MKKKEIDAFFELLRSGIWEKETRFSLSGEIDYNDVIKIAEEQSVVGLVTAGINMVQNVKVPQNISLQLIAQALQLEQRNKAMNMFIASLVEKLRMADIYALLVKGQGIAQCYDKPLWRACGDVDLFLDEDNYVKAKGLLVPLASSVEHEYVEEMHLGMSIDGFDVELHGSLRSGLSSQVEKGLDEIKHTVFFEGKVRSWKNDKTQVFLLGADEDAVYVFVHILQHFYKEGVGLRQICDWCRLLWTYRDEIDVKKMERRIRRMGLVSEWKAFGAFAIEYLGMPIDAMPLYSDDAKWKRKADMICTFILEVGNMGHKRDMSYFDKYPYVIRKVFSMRRRCGDLIRHARIFPLDSMRFFPRIMLNGLKSAARGE